MSLFADYKKEREGKLVVESEKGFAVYSISREGCYIEDIFVLPEYRKQHVAKEMADFIVKIAKAKDCNVLYGSVSPSANGANDSLKVLLSYGMKIHSSKNDLVFFVKEI